MIRACLFLSIATLCLSSCQRQNSAPEEEGTPRSGLNRSEPLTAEGWGPLQIGMTRESVVAAAGEDANPAAVGGPDPEQCDEFRPSRAPAGMLVMIEQGRLTRITLIRGSDVETAEGFGVGDSASVIKAAYGARAQVTPHKYLPAPAEYITIWRMPPPSPEARGIVYVSVQSSDGVA